MSREKPTNKKERAKSVFDMECALKQATRSLFLLRIARETIMLEPPIEDQLALGGALPEIRVILQEHTLRDIYLMIRDLRTRISALKREIRLRKQRNAFFISARGRSNNAFGGNSGAGGLAA